MSDKLEGPDGRIARAMGRAGLNPNQLASRIGELRGKTVTASTPYGWVSKDKPSPPTAEYLEWLPEALGVDAFWLLTGRGDPKPVPQSEAQRRLWLVRQAVDDATNVAAAEAMFERILGGGYPPTQDVDDEGL